VVRLEQGDFERETAFSEDPVAVASAFSEAGIRWLHVVDLDGARSGSPVHVATISAILATVGERTLVDAAGGLRDEAAVATILAAGAARAVVGTASLADPEFAGRLVAEHGVRSVAAAIDVRDGRAIGHGWTTAAPGVDAAQAIAGLADAGVETFEVTAIDRDGLLGGPDFDLYRRIIALDRGRVIASGGIATLHDLRALRDVGCAGAIVGRALYTKQLDLADLVAFEAEAS
jgi:phosphoribosylformimino-5-aminoimidazole carboxamide ribotide isomerase